MLNFANNKPLPNFGHVEAGCGSNNIKHIPNSCDVYMREKYDEDADRSNSIQKSKTALCLV